MIISRVDGPKHADKSKKGQGLTSGSDLVRVQICPVYHLKVILPPLLWHAFHNVGGRNHLGHGTLPGFPPREESLYTSPKRMSCQSIDCNLSCCPQWKRVGLMGDSNKEGLLEGVGLNRTVVVAESIPRAKG